MQRELSSECETEGLFWCTFQLLQSLRHGVAVPPPFAQGRLKVSKCFSTKQKNTPYRKPLEVQSVAKINVFGENNQKSKFLGLFSY